MKASELISSLQETIGKDGDLQVVVSGLIWYMETIGVETIPAVKIIKHNGIDCNEEQCRLILIST